MTGIRGRGAVNRKQKKEDRIQSADQWLMMQKKGGQICGRNRFQSFWKTRRDVWPKLQPFLQKPDVNIRALAVADTSDFGVLRLIVDDNIKAVEALKNHGFTVGKTDVVAVEVEDRPGGLHRILDILHKAGINVEYMYAFVQHSGKNAVMIFRIDNIAEAVKILQEHR